MGSSILKGKRDADLYCVWSTVVAQPTLIGTRQEIVDRLAEHHFEEGGRQCMAEPPSYNHARCDRADEQGTSLKHRPSYGRWDDDFLIVANYGILPRDRLYDFLVILKDSQEWFDTGEPPAEALVLLEPFDDRDEDWT